MIQYADNLHLGAPGAILNNRVYKPASHCLWRSSMFYTFPPSCLLYCRQISLAIHKWWHFNITKANPNRSYFPRRDGVYRRNTWTARRLHRSRQISRGGFRQEDSLVCANLKCLFQSYRRVHPFETIHQQSKIVRPHEATFCLCRGCQTLLYGRSCFHPEL